MILCLVSSRSWAEGQKEYKVKAAYLYHFTRFIEWPSEAFSTSDNTFHLCIAGQNPFGQYLKPLAEKNYRGKNITLHYTQYVSEISHCQLLYINSENQEAAFLNAANNASILTISSSPDFIERGGMIGFLAINERVRLEINLDVARQANLKISAMLLEVAIRVKSNYLQGERL